jgi:dethiobiotin synthetase
MTGRPLAVVAVVGTATDVGKTWIAAALLPRLAAAGRSVSARKPVQSFATDARISDAELLAAATGEDPLRVCPTHRRYALAMAPPIAARRLGRAPIEMGDLQMELQWPHGTEIGVVETVGGVRSPMADDGDSATFVKLIAPDHVLLVTDAGLGAINAVRLSVTALDSLPTTVMLNRFNGDDEVHESNRAWLADRDGLTVVTTMAQCVATVLALPSLGGTDPRR